MGSPEIGKDEHGFPVYACDPTPPNGWVSDDGETWDATEGEKPAIDLGAGFGLSADERPRWLHACSILRPDGRRTARLLAWCGLAPAHVVTRSPAGVTIRASILCHRCGAHGFVTDSKWKNA